MAKHSGQFKAVVFDMDGLLLDTEKLLWELFDKACQEEGFYPDFETYSDTVGKNVSATRDIFQAKYGAKFPWEPVHDKWHAYYVDWVENKPIPVKTGVTELLTWLNDTGIPAAVATATRKPLALLKLKHVGLDHHFEHIVSCDEVANPKPAPDVHLHAMSLLGDWHHDDYLILEDSNTGATAALATKAHTCQIPDLMVPDTAFADQPNYSSRDSLHEVLHWLKRAR